jgi:hypothetical protein
VGGQEALAEKGGVDAVRIVAFAYDSYTNPSKNNGVLRATLTFLLVSFTVETTVLPSFAHRAAARFVTREGPSSSHDPNFSREAAFLLNAMAALPRKWVSDGAPTLPWIHGSALRDKLI